MSGAEILEAPTNGMLVHHDTLETVGSLQAVPLQFGGGFIELAVLFLILAVVAAVLGARGIAGLSMNIAKWLVIIFVILAVVTFVL